jgi:hypothetical protein
LAKFLVREMIASHERCAKILPVFAKQSMRYLQRGNFMARGDVHDGIHLASHACVMHRDNRLRARRDRGFELRFIQIKGIRPNI